jgi:hypothetical protein
MWTIPPNKLRLKKFFDPANQRFSYPTKIFSLLPAQPDTGTKSEILH